MLEPSSHGLPSPPDCHSGAGEHSEDQAEEGDGDAEEKPVSKITVVNAPKDRGDDVAQVLAAGQIEPAELPGIAIDEDGRIPAMAAPIKFERTAYE